MRVVIALLVGLSAVAFFSFLLYIGLLGELAYSSLVAGSAVVALVIYGFPRLAELDLRNLRIILREVKEATNEAKDAAQQLEKVKREVANMYGGIEKLQREPYVLDESKQSELGLGGAGLAMASATMRYPAGCIKRERERLARVFVNLQEKTPEELAQAILDGSMDDKVFKWNGPECGLDAPPKSAEARKAANEAKQSDSGANDR